MEVLAVSGAAAAAGDSIERFRILAGRRVRGDDVFLLAEVPEIPRRQYVIGVDSRTWIGVMQLGAAGAIAYLDRFNTSVGNFTTKGRTLGAVAYLNRGEWSFIPEYDFNSNWAGEDSFSIKVSKRFAKMNRDPRVIVGAAKHNSFVAGVRMTLH